MFISILAILVILGSNTVVEGGDDPGAWVATWTAMPQLTEPGNLPPPPYTKPNVVFQDATIRQTLHISIPGSKLRVRFSNVFGTQPLPITAANIALPAGGKAGVSAIQPNTVKNLTLNGDQSFTLPSGTQIDTDEIDFDVQANSILTVTLYLATGQQSNNITGHPGSRTTSYFAQGNHVVDTDLTGAANAEHWYFINVVDVWTNPEAAAVVVIGDSISDGRGSTTNGNNRWTDQLITRLLADSSTKNLIAVLNQAAGGNRVLHDGLGPSAVSRINRDVLGINGVKWVILFEGVNDIGTAAATTQAQNSLVSQLTAGYQQIINQVKSKGIKIYGATITPFGGQGQPYDDPQGIREAARQQVNNWIRTGYSDGFLDFDKIARDPNRQRQLLPAYDVGDHLHMNPVGYKAIADSIPLTLFNQSTLIE